MGSIYLHNVSQILKFFFHQKKIFLDLPSYLKGRAKDAHLLVTVSFPEQPGQVGARSQELS